MHTLKNLHEHGEINLPLAYLAEEWFIKLLLPLE